MNEYAYYGKEHTIHSSGQIEWHKNTVDDKSVKVGGTQWINTLDVDLIDPNFYHQGLYTKRASNTLSSLADVYIIPPMAISSSTQACNTK